jgi:hypothetical protein
VGRLRGNNGFRQPYLILASHIPFERLRDAQLSDHVARHLNAEQQILRRDALVNAVHAANVVRFKDARAKAIRGITAHPPVAPIGRAGHEQRKDAAPGTWWLTAWVTAR